MKYDAMYFLKKFDKIPDNEWCTGHFVDPSNKTKMCALGHCGYRSYITFPDRGPTEEGMALSMLLVKTLYIVTPIINDASDPTNPIDAADALQLGSTPKERIMNALWLAYAGAKV